MKRGHGTIARAALLGAAVLVAEAAALHAAVDGAGRWLREGQGAALARAARIAAHAVTEGVRERVADARVERACLATRRGAPDGAFVLARSLRHRAGPGGHVVVVRAECGAGTIESSFRERALREAVAKLEAITSGI